MTDDDDKPKPKPKPIDEVFGTPPAAPLLPPMPDGPLPVYRGTSPPTERPTPGSPLPPSPARRPPTQPPPIPQVDRSRPVWATQPVPAPEAPEVPSPVVPPVVATDPPVVVEEPLLPASYSEQDLRSAVGVAPLTESRPTRAPDLAFTHDAVGDDYDPDRKDKKPGGRATIIVAIFSVLIGLAIATFVLLGRINSNRYVITCGAQQIIAQQGRSFPPWGESPLTGAQWKPIPIPPEAVCEPLDTEDLDAVTISYRDRLVQRAEDTLMKGDGTKVDEAAAMLEQAQILARDPRYQDARKYIQRVLGDVTYWRASKKLEEAARLLQDASKQFETAVASQPRIATDADAWARFVKELTAKLQAGPAGVRQAFPPTPPPAEGSGRTPAPPGVALPVEPEATGSGSAVQPAPDAGVPSGGVLL